MDLSRLIIINSNLSKKRVITREKETFHKVNRYSWMYWWPQLGTSPCIHGFWNSLNYIECISYSSTLCLLMLLVWWKKKKKKDGQTDWLTSRRGLKKYLCVTIFSHFSAVIMRICLRYPFLRILETNTWERWVNPIKPVIEKSIDNFQKWGNVKEQKGKKNLQSQWANLPLIGIRS